MGEPAAPREAGRLPSLTSLRWYGAFAVFGYHLHLDDFRWAPVDLLSAGYTGVAFFFVLSGFVLTWSARPGVPSSTFYLRRFARIYPAHLTVLVVLAVVAATGVEHRATFRTDGAGAALHLTLLQAWWPGDRHTGDWNTVSWSLSAEAFFYAVFPLVLRGMVRASPRVRAVTTAAALVGGAAAQLALVHLDPVGGQSTATFLPLLRLPEFLLGVWLALQVRDGRLRSRAPLWLPVVVCLALVVVAGRLAVLPAPLGNTLVLPGVALLVVTAAQRDLSGRTGRILGNPVSVYLGELSFCFYLVHALLINTVLDTRGWKASWDLVAGVGPAATLLVVPLVLAAALHHGVEKPANRLLLRRRSSRDPSPAGRPAPVPTP